MSRKKQVNQKITALYCRISLEDGGDNESMSISNQKLMLRDFAEKNGMFQYEYYVDDGYTGRNFNRPSFQRMIADIEAGKIGCVITKDLSRLGRNYIEAGSYIEIFFPKHNVRYIAITDGVDSLTRQEMDITPFKNILNDMYSRDISKKVLAGRMTRSRQGKFCGGQPPLGLMRDPEDKGHLIRDPETAPVIRKIYDMALDGWGCMRIAKQLMDDKVPITRVKSNTECDVNYYSWGSARISHILRNPFYKGAHLVCRTHQKGIRSNTYDIIPREDWEIIEDCHEAIISPEEWEQVQERDLLPVIILCDRLVRSQHAVLDQHRRRVPLIRPDLDRASLCVQDDLALREIKVDRTARHALFPQHTGRLIEKQEHRNEICIFFEALLCKFRFFLRFLFLRCIRLRFLSPILCLQDRIHRRVCHSAVDPDDRLTDLMSHDDPFFIDIHETAHCQAVAARIQGTDPVGKPVRQHGTA